MNTGHTLSGAEFNELITLLGFERTPALRLDHLEVSVYLTQRFVSQELIIGTR